MVPLRGHVELNDANRKAESPHVTPGRERRIVTLVKRSAFAFWLVAAAAATPVALVSAAGGLPHTPRWSITDLGTLPGHPYAFVQPVGLNDKGAVIAEGTWDTTHQAAFLWRNGKRTPDRKSVV